MNFFYRKNKKQEDGVNNEENLISPNLADNNNNLENVEQVNNNLPTENSEVRSENPVSELPPPVQSELSNSEEAGTKKKSKFRIFLGRKNKRSESVSNEEPAENEKKEDEIRVIDGEEVKAEEAAAAQDSVPKELKKKSSFRFFGRNKSKNNENLTVEETTEKKEEDEKVEKKDSEIRALDEEEVKAEEAAAQESVPKELKKKSSFRFFGRSKSKKKDTLPAEEAAENTTSEAIAAAGTGVVVAAATEQASEAFSDKFEDAKDEKLIESQDAKLMIEESKEVEEVKEDKEVEETKDEKSIEQELQNQEKEDEKRNSGIFDAIRVEDVEETKPENDEIKLDGLLEAKEESFEKKEDEKEEAKDEKVILEEEVKEEVETKVIEKAEDERKEPEEEKPKENESDEHETVSIDDSEKKEIDQEAEKELNALLDASNAETKEKAQSEEDIVKAAFDDELFVAATKDIDELKEKEDEKKDEDVEKLNNLESEIERDLDNGSSEPQKIFDLQEQDDQDINEFVRQVEETDSNKLEDEMPPKFSEEVKAESEQEGAETQKDENEIQLEDENKKSEEVADMKAEETEKEVVEKDDETPLWNSISHVPVEEKLSVSRAESLEQAEETQNVSIDEEVEKPKTEDELAAETKPAEVELASIHETDESKKSVDDFALAREMEERNEDNEDQIEMVPSTVEELNDVEDEEKGESSKYSGMIPSVTSMYASLCGKTQVVDEQEPSKDENEVQLLTNFEEEIEHEQATEAEMKTEQPSSRFPSISRFYEKLCGKATSAVADDTEEVKDEEHEDESAEESEKSIENVAMESTQEPVKDAKVEVMDLPIALPSASNVSDESEFGESVGMGGVEVWRVRKFGLEKLDDFAGDFYSGDCYLILNTNFPKNGKATYDIHFWIGKDSTLDEQAVAAIKAVELDQRFNGRAIQHREEEYYESQKFQTYFVGMRHLKGGYPSGLQQTPPEFRSGYKRLFWIKRKKKSCQYYEINISNPNENHAKKLNHGDVFVLDLGGEVFQWNGNKSNPIEKFHACLVVNNIVKDRNGSSKKSTITNEKFWQALNGTADDVQPEIEDTLDEAKLLEIRSQLLGIEHAHEESLNMESLKLYRISDASGKTTFELIEGKPSKSFLDPSDVFLLHANIGIWIWEGADSTNNEKASGFRLAKKFIEDYKLSPHLPVTRIRDGQSDMLFDSFFTADNNYRI